MSILKQAILWLGYSGHETRGFSLLPAIFSSVTWRPGKVTSSAARDNVHRFKKEFFYMMPYGLTLGQEHDVFWLFKAPKGWVINYGVPWRDANYLRAEYTDHYSTVKGRFISVMMRNGKMKLRKKME